MQASTDEKDQTRTLRGLGLLRDTLRGIGDAAAASPARAIPCPCCRVKDDGIGGDLAACFAMALVLVQGAEPSRARLCTMHARLLRLLMTEIQAGPHTEKDGTSWDD
jgi:hypothetical protein